MKKRNLCLSLSALAITLISGQQLSAVTVTNGNLGVLAATTTVSGTLANQNAALQEAFSLSTASNLTIFTTSYGGGMNANGTTAAAGGFMPSLVLYNAAGNFVDGQIFPSPIGKVDPSTNLNGDSYIKTNNLAAGSYILALSDFLVQQSPTATNLSDGFINYGGGTTFSDVQGNLRNGNYTLNFTSVSATPVPPSAVPEPSTVLLIIPAALVGAISLRRKRVVPVS